MVDGEFELLNVEEGTGFNEAAAVRPQMDAIRPARAASGPCFNEAAAVRPQMDVWRSCFGREGDRASMRLRR